MSELTRMKIAFEEFKKDFSDCASKPRRISGINEKAEFNQAVERMKINGLLIIELFQYIYPKEIQGKFKEETNNDFSSWKFIFKELAWIGGDDLTVNFPKKDVTRKFVVFFETLLVTKVPIEDEIRQLEYQLDRLTTQLSVGQIGEHTYNRASKRIENRIQKLKSLEISQK